MWRSPGSGWLDRTPTGVPAGIPSATPSLPRDTVTGGSWTLVTVMTKGVSKTAPSLSVTRTRTSHRSVVSWSRPDGAVRRVSPSTRKRPLSPPPSPDTREKENAYPRSGVAVSVPTRVSGAFSGTAAPSRVMPVGPWWRMAMVSVCSTSSPSSSVDRTRMSQASRTEWSRTSAVPKVSPSMAKEPLSSSPSPPTSSYV